MKNLRAEIVRRSIIARFTAECESHRGITKFIGNGSVASVPEGVHVEAMALLLIDDAEAGASGWILAVAGTPAYRHLLVREGDAHLAVEAVVAVSGRVSALTRGFRFRVRRRRRAPRK